MGDAEPDVQKALAWAYRSLTAWIARRPRPRSAPRPSAPLATGDGHRAWVIRDTLASSTRPSPTSCGPASPASASARARRRPRPRPRPPPASARCLTRRRARAPADDHPTRRPPDPTGVDPTVTDDLGDIRIDPHRGRDAGQLPRLRDERHRVARPARRPRRLQARPPPDPLRDGRDGPVVHQLVPQVRRDRRRGDGQVPPARRQRAVRRPRPARPGLLDALPAGRRPGQLRLGRWRHARPRCATRRRA